jgi:hypothetical protein
MIVIEPFFLYKASENIIREFILLFAISTRTDSYGPGGHPKPETRDYSLSWKKISKKNAGKGVRRICGIRNRCFQ